MLCERRMYSVIVAGALLACAGRSPTALADGRAWVECTPGPTPRYGHSQGYDSARGVTVLFGGTEGSLNGETWEWDGSTWTLVSTSGPSPRYGCAAVFDSSRSVLVLFGGLDGSYDGETWEFGADCNNNGVPDAHDVADCDGSSWCQDCNGNGVPDPCDLADCDGSAWCSDCNWNGILDACDISAGSSRDCNLNGTPDECEPGVTCADLWLSHTSVAGGFASSADYMTITTTGQAGGVGPQLFAPFSTSNGFVPVAVNPGWPPIYGDLDCDGDVDIDDMDVMLTCLSGPDVTTPPPGADPLLFAAADLDEDLDVDMEDVALFQAITRAP